LKYRSKPKNNNGGKTFFFVTLSIFIVLVGGWFSILPYEFQKCDPATSLKECNCPADKDNISNKNVILVDITNQIPAGKIPDIENLIESYALKADSFFTWFGNGKKVEKTSIYVLSNSIPSSMLPIGTFCRPPPEIALIASTSNSKLKAMQAGVKEEIKNVMRPILQANNAQTSPIIETMAVVTSNATAWTPGGDFVLISDMLQNTAECGWFDGGNSIPTYNSTPKTCRPYIDKFQANTQPTSINRGKTNVAVCLIPPIQGKQPKAGLMSFWHEFVQDALNYDLIATCNPSEINARKASLH